MDMENHGDGESWKWKITEMENHGDGESWKWKNTEMENHGDGESWRWTITEMENHGYEKITEMENHGDLKSQRGLCTVGLLAIVSTCFRSKCAQTAYFPRSMPLCALCHPLFCKWMILVAIVSDPPQMQMTKRSVQNVQNVKKISANTLTNRYFPTWINNKFVLNCSKELCTCSKCFCLCILQAFALCPRIFVCTAVYLGFKSKKKWDGNGSNQHKLPVCMSVCDRN